MSKRVDEVLEAMRQIQTTTKDKEHRKAIERRLAQFEESRKAKKGCFRYMVLIWMRLVRKAKK